MRRFASHYIYIPSCGFLKQFIVELTEEGYVSSLHKFVEEAESIIWTPGVIGLFHQQTLRRGNSVEINKEEIYNKLISESSSLQTELPTEYTGNIDCLQLNAIRFYPFDYTFMKPTIDTQLQVLGHDWFIC